MCFEQFNAQQDTFISLVLNNMQLFFLWVVQCLVQFIAKANHFPWARWPCFIRLQSTREKCAIVKVTSRKICFYATSPRCTSHNYKHTRKLCNHLKFSLRLFFIAH